MAEAYVLTTALYSGRSVVAVYSDYELACRMLAKWKGRYSSLELETHETDQEFPEWSYWIIAMERNGDIRFTRNDIDMEPREDRELKYRLNPISGPGEYFYLLNIMLTRDKTEAIKRTNQLRARLIAENKWPLEPISSKRANARL